MNKTRRLLKKTGIIALITNTLIASTIGYTGNIKDKKGNNPQETINIEWVNQQIQTQTNEEGEFTIQTNTNNINNNDIAKNYELKQNYPNPFNPTTNIEIQTKEPGKITIHDILGRTINEINIPTPGQYTIQWGGTNKKGQTVSSGTYIYKLTTNKHTESKKMTVLEGGNSGLTITKQTNNNNNQTLKKQQNTETDTLKITSENTTDKKQTYTRREGITNTGTITINTGPIIKQEIPTQNTFKGDTLTINLNNYIYNDEKGLYLLSNNENFKIEQDTILKYYAETTGTTNTTITAKDREDHTLTKNLELIINTTTKNNPPNQIKNIEEQEIHATDTLTINMKKYVTDPDNDELTYTIEHTQINYKQEKDTLKITIKDTTQTNNIENIIINANDGELNTTLNPFNINIKPLNNVKFIIKDYYTDSTLTTDTSTFWIDEKEYKRTNGELNIKLKDGTYEFNATNPNTADGTSDLLAEFYTFLRRPSDTENFEQRDKIDHTSPITITKNDTIIAYKLMKDVQTLQGLLLYVDHGQGTKRFSASLDSVPAWWNTNYMTPDSTTRAIVQELLYNKLPEASKNKLKFKYTESTTDPGFPKLKIEMDSSFPSPGTNVTTYDDNNNIYLARARWPPGPTTRNLWIEILQATCGLSDSGGTDPPILTYDLENSEWNINDLGQKLISFIYFVHPKTRI